MYLENCADLVMVGFYHHLFGLCAIFINLLHYIVFSFKDQRCPAKDFTTTYHLYLDLHYFCCLMTFLLLSTYVIVFFLLKQFAYVLHVTLCLNYFHTTYSFIIWVESNNELHPCLESRLLISFLWWWILSFCLPRVYEKGCIICSW